MGYALFANRKLVLTNTVNMLQMQLDSIMMQKNSLLQFSANIADGALTAEELASDATNMPYYESFSNRLAEFASGEEVMDAAGRVNENAHAQNPNAATDDAYMINIQTLFDESVRKKFVEAEMKKVAVQENMLEIQQKKIETQLTKAQNDLKAVEEAEGQAIQNATPKFAGLG